MLNPYKGSAEVIYQYKLIVQFKKHMLKQSKFLSIKEQLNQLGYEVPRTLGSGGFGEVVLAVKNGKQYAIKSIPKQMITNKPQLNKYIRNQYEVMKALEHKNIIRQQGHIENQEHFFMILQYCNLGNLLSLQAKKPKKCFSVKQTIKIISDVLKGLKQIHMNKFIHRDIKPQNILLKLEDGVVIYKIADFGFARPIENNSVGTHCGTSSFMAPEILQNKPYGISVDLWSLGVVMYFMLFAQYPFKGMNLLTDIQSKCYKGFDIKKHLRKDKLEEYSDELQDFFNRIFVIDPKKRISIGQIFVHPLFSSIFGVLKQKDCQSTLESDGNQENNPSHQEQIKQLLFQRQKVEYLKIVYLKISSDSFKKMINNAKQYDLVSAQFYLLKAMIFFTKKSLIGLNSKVVPTNFSSLPKWKQFCASNQAKKWIDQLQEEIAGLNSQFSDLNSRIIKQKIQVPGFKDCLNPEVTENQFEEFKGSYRSAIGNVFKLIHTNENLNLSNKNQLKLQMICCHLINRVFENKHIQANFQNYYGKYHIFNNKYFMIWIGEQNKDILDKTITLLHKRYLNIK